MDDDFNGQGLYDDYGSQINSDIAQSLANASQSASSLMRDLKANSTRKEIDEATEDEKNLQESDNKKELGEESSKDQHDELGEGNESGDELGEENRADKHDELGEGDAGDNEIGNDSDGSDADSDGDGTPDSEDSDDDGDGTPDEDDEDEKDDDKDDDDEKKVGIRGKINEIKRKIRILKFKIKLIAIGTVIGLLLLLFIIGSVVVPLDAASQTIKGFVNEVSEFGGKLINLFDFKGFGSDEQVFWKELDKQYNNFSTRAAYCEQLDIALLAATIQYDVVIDSEYFESEETDFTQREDSSDAVETIIESDKAPAFYEWAYNVLGNFDTFIIEDRGLSGALVSEKYDGNCEPATFETFFDMLWDSFGYAVESVIHKAFATVKDTAQNLNIFAIGKEFLADTQRTNDNVIQFLFNEIKENRATVETFGYDIANYVNFPKLECGRKEVEVEEDCDNCTYRDGKYYQTKYTVPIYQRKLWNDYSKYDSYLKTYYIPRYYINCSNCAYKNLSDDEKAEKTQSILEDIYKYKEFYQDLLGIENNFEECGDMSLVYTGVAGCPVPPGTGASRRWGMGKQIINGVWTGESSMHRGIDFVPGYGAPVFAIADGNVVVAGGGGEYGNYVVIDHGTGLSTAYGHLSAILVSAGQPVKAGQQVGRVGSTGNSTGPHLHFETRLNGVAVNPDGVINCNQ